METGTRCSQDSIFPALTVCGLPLSLWLGFLLTMKNSSWESHVITFDSKKRLTDFFLPSSSLVLKFQERILIGLAWGKSTQRQSTMTWTWILKNHMVRVGRGPVPSMWEMLFTKDREVYQVDTGTEGTYCFLKGPMLPRSNLGKCDMSAWQEGMKRRSTYLKDIICLIRSNLVGTSLKFFKQKGRNHPHI